MQSKIFQADDEKGAIFSDAVGEPAIPQHLTDEDVIAAVDNLPINYRAVVLFADVEEFSYRETAEILNIPIGTVMSRLNRARKQLRQTLADVAPDYGVKNSAAAFVNQTANCVVQ